MATVQDLVTAALQEIGVIALGETPSSGESSDALLRLNRFIDTCAADKLTIYAVTRTLATLTASQASFTVGTGGNINIARPNFLERVGFVDTAPNPDIEYPLEGPLTEQEWAQVALKALTATLPTACYYSPTYPTGTLYPWPIPTQSGLQWAVYAWTAVTQFAALSTTVSLPPAYEEMLVTNLALLLCPANERMPNPLLADRAAKTMATVKRWNQRVTELRFGAETLSGTGGASYNINTDA